MADGIMESTTNSGNWMQTEKEALIEPRNYGDITVKQPKDESVIDLVKRKVENGERVIIYTAWTRLDTQTKLHTMLTNENIKTAILDQRVPTVKREEWVDKRLAEGVKVLIVKTNASHGFGKILEILNLMKYLLMIQKL